MKKTSKVSKKPTTKSAPDPAPQIMGKTVRLSFRLPATKDEPARTTSLSLKSRVVAMWLVSELISVPQSKKGSKDRLNDWKKHLYNFLNPLIKEEYLNHLDPSVISLSDLAFNLLLKDTLKTLSLSFCSTNQLEPKKIDREIDRKIDNFYFTCDQITEGLVNSNMKPINLVLDMTKTSPKQTDKVDKAGKVRNKKTKKRKVKISKKK